MPPSITTDDSERRCVATFQGEISYETLADYFKGRLAENSFGYDQLLVATEASLAMDSKAISSLVLFMERAAAQATPGRIAIVTNDLLSYGLLRMFSSLALGHGAIAVFRARRSGAVAWLVGIAAACSERARAARFAVLPPADR
jgi:hypothetical protein